MSESAASRLVFGRSFSEASCSSSGVTPTTVELAVGEGRVFRSPNYPSNYPNLQECTYNFQPASGAQLRFSCDDFDLTATSAAGALCTGDYLRFYDSTGSLGSSVIDTATTLHLASRTPTTSLFCSRLIMMALL